MPKAMKSILFTLYSAVVLAALAGASDLQPGHEFEVSGPAPVVLDTVLRPGERASFDIITDKAGPQPWEQLRVFVDYADKNNHTDIVLTSFNTLVVAEVRNGQRRKIHEPQGRGKPDRWQRVDLEATREGLQLTLGMRPEILIPWRDPSAPGKLAFSATQGASGRVHWLGSGPAPVRSDGPLSLHPLFSDDAVLPHGREVRVCGKAVPGAEVTLFLDGEPAGAAKADAEGRWKIALPPQQAGEPHTLAVASDNRRIERRGVLFGEVWFCSGQSNMLWRLADSDDADAEAKKIAAADNVRVFPVHIETADTERTDPPTPSAWLKPDSSSARHLSAIGQIFGVELAGKLGMPVGIILSAKGGSRIEPWMSTEARAKVEKEVGPYNAEYREKLGKHENPPGSLFNAMVVPYLDLPVTGVAWYQGESNAWRGWHYRRQLAALVADWRQRFGQPSLPFLLVQLPLFAGKDMDPEAPIWSDLREAQAQVAEADKNVHLIVTLDCGDAKDIHPRAKRPVAERLTAAALAHIYKKPGVVADPPRVVKSEPIPGGMAVVFDRAVEFVPGGERDFQLAESGRPFAAAKEVRHPAPERLEILAASGNPTELRYGWKNVVKAALHGPEGLAVAPFRTDSRPGLSDQLQ